MALLESDRVTLTETIKGIASVARSWLDVDYPSRVKAIEATLSAPNRFTEEAIHFAVNQQMHQLTEKNMSTWLGSRQPAEASIVGVLNPGNVPFADLQDFVAVAITGCPYRGSVSTKSPFLLPAFVMDVKSKCGSIQAEFVSRDVLIDGVQKCIATGNDAALNWARAEADAAGLESKDILLRGSGFGVAILTGSENDDDLEKLAEDTLLHEGLGCRNVALIWAPTGYQPDALLDAFAHFRAVFPGHPDTAGSIEMQRAFLKAIDAPHAFGDDHSFLLSKGEPEIQSPGHIRLAEYDNLQQVMSWVAKNEEFVQVIVSGEPQNLGLHGSLRLGFAQRPRLGWSQSGVDVISFLSNQAPGIT